MSDTEDFWAYAPALFEQVSALGSALASSVLTDDIREGVRRVAELIPETPEPLSAMDPYLRSAFLMAVIHAMRSEEAGDRKELRIAIERIRQALRDVLDEHPVWRGGPKHAALWLRQQGLSVADLADLFGTSETTVRRWVNPDDDTKPAGDQADRVVVIAKIVNHLRHAMTPRGAVQWLGRPHPALDDRAPIDELKDAESYQRLIHLASGIRSFVAT
jgi:AraC-like DNA-binding protein